MAGKGERNPLQVLIDWLSQRLERTIFFGLHFTLPKRFVSPLGFLGMLTFVVFSILGVTGALLLLYYVPTADSAYASVSRIEEQIPFGIDIRNIHYHASNAMVLLALAHMFYQFFSGRYKLRYEVLWITGILLGTLTVLEAYTGYDLILNERALLAINIGRALARSTPILGPTLYEIMVGSGLGDLVVRFYAVHVFIFPLIMVTLMLVHFPRYLILDIPVVSMISGIILIMGGLFPVELGIKFVAERPVGILLPEWYLTGLYALIRTGIPAFVAGAVLPTVFIVMFLVVPFLDTSRKLSVRDRPFFTALGVAGIGQIFVSTVWGFRGSNPFEALQGIGQLMIDPYVFFGTIAIVSSVCYGAVYSWTRLTRPGGGAQRTKPPTRRFPTYKLGTAEWRTIILALLAFQIIFDIYALQASLLGLKNIVLIELGSVLVAFGVLAHVHRLGSEAR